MFMLSNFVDSQYISNKEDMSLNDMTRSDMIMRVANTRPRVEYIHLPNTIEIRALTQSGG